MIGAFPVTMQIDGGGVSKIEASPAVPIRISDNVAMNQWNPAIGQRMRDFET
jgi:hypothetical protein